MSSSEEEDGDRRRPANAFSFLAEDVLSLLLASLDVTSLHAWYMSNVTDKSYTWLRQQSSVFFERVVQSLHTGYIGDNASEFGDRRVAAALSWSQRCSRGLTSICLCISNEEAFGVVDWGGQFCDPDWMTNLEHLRVLRLKLGKNRNVKHDAPPGPLEASTELPYSAPNSHLEALAQAARQGRLKRLVSLSVEQLYYDDPEEGGVFRYSQVTNFVAEVRRHCPLLQRLDGFEHWYTTSAGFFSSAWPCLTSLDVGSLLYATHEVAEVEVQNGNEGVVAAAALGGGGGGGGANEEDPDAFKFASCAVLRGLFAERLFPSLSSIELCFSDTNHMLQFFTHWVFCALAPSSATSKSGSGKKSGVFSTASITKLTIDTGQMRATDQFELYPQWNDLVRKTASKKMAPLLPNLQVLELNCWLPCQQFLTLLVGNNAHPHSIHLQVCPGDEDPSFASFLNHVWDASRLRFDSFVVKRRELMPRGVNTNFYAAGGDSTATRALEGEKPYGSLGFQDEYEVDDPFFVQGADVGPKSAVVKALEEALRAGKFCETHTLGIPEYLLQHIGCSRGEAPSSPQLTRNICSLFNSCLDLRKVIIYMQHPRRVPTTPSRIRVATNELFNFICAVVRLAFEAREKTVEGKDAVEEKRGEGKGALEEEEEGERTSAFGQLQVLEIDVPCNTLYDNVREDLGSFELVVGSHTYSFSLEPSAFIGIKLYLLGARPRSTLFLICKED